jgi:dTDP-3-amino-3,4,6-trideoxy-alpha-D-glucose transaminase
VHARASAAEATRGPRIPRVDLNAQHDALRDGLDQAIKRVMASGWFVLGPEVEAFEKEFAAYCGAAHCVTVGSGTDALRLALTACDLRHGDEVVTVSHTAPATVFAIELTGATPVLVDVDPDTHTIDPARAAEALGPRTRAIVPVNIYGRCADLGALTRLAEEHGLWLIEDCAQAHGARHGAARAGTIGHLGCFSFYPTKNLGALGDGGAVVTGDAELAAKVRLLRDYGRGARDRHEIVAGNSRLDELQAAILRVKLGHLDAWNAARRSRAAAYSELLEDVEIRLPPADESGEHVYHLYVVSTPGRDELAAHLRAHGVGSGVHYAVPVHLQPAYAERQGPSSLEVTERAAREVLSLPMYPELRAGDVERVADLVRGHLRPTAR